MAKTKPKTKSKRTSALVERANALNRRRSRCPLAEQARGPGDHRHELSDHLVDYARRQVPPAPASMAAARCGYRPTSMPGSPACRYVR